MNKKQISLSFIPIIGILVYLIPIFFQSVLSENNSKWLRAGGAFFLGMISFIVLYGGFALINNLFKLNLENSLWLLYAMLYLSFVIWNVVFFLSYNRLTRKSS